MVLNFTKKMGAHPKNSKMEKNRKKHHILMQYGGTIYALHHII